MPYKTLTKFPCCFHKTHCLSRIFGVFFFSVLFLFCQSMMCVHVCYGLSTYALPKRYANDLSPSYNSFFLIVLSLAYARLSPIRWSLLKKVHVFEPTNLWPSQNVITYDILHLVSFRFFAFIPVLASSLRL